MDHVQKLPGEQKWWKDDNSGGEPRDKESSSPLPAPDSEIHKIPQPGNIYDSWREIMGIVESKIKLLGRLLEKSAVIVVTSKWHPNIVLTL